MKDDVRGRTLSLRRDSTNSGGRSDATLATVVAVVDVCEDLTPTNRRLVVLLALADVSFRSLVSSSYF